jgi:hypothetical protein
MIHYIETQTKDGSTIRIEVADTSRPSAGFARSTTSTHISTDATKDAYNQLLTTIQYCANGVIETIQNLEALPNAASIDFAVKIDAEAGAMIAKSREDAQFRVSLSWKQAEPEGKKEE